MIVEVSFEELQSLLRAKVSMEKVRNALDMFGTPVDEVDEEQKLLRVEVFPNRIDMLSVEGMARALNGFLGFEPGLPKFNLFDPGIRVFVESKETRPYLAFSSVFGVKFSEEAIKSIMQMQEKVHLTHGRNRRKYSIGLYDLDAIEPPIYVKELPLEDIRFVPLGEEREMNGREILEKTEKGRAYRHLVGNKAMVFVDSEGQILSMPPIINADFCRVTEKTRNVLIDSTGTAPGVNGVVAVFASNLFERGDKIGLIEPGPRFENRAIEVELEKINRLLGLNLSEEEIARALARMRLELKGKIVLIPPYRLDIWHWYDVAEDVAIGYGFEKLKPSMPSFALIGKSDPGRDYRNKIREILLGLGFTEARTFFLTNPELFLEEPVTVANAKSREFSALRNRLLPGLLELLYINKSEPYPQLLFEIGRIYNGREEWHVAGVIAKKDANFAEVKGIVEKLLEILGIKANWEDGSDPYFISGRCAKSELGVFGEVKPELVAKIGMPVAAFELKIG